MTVWKTETDEGTKYQVRNESGDKTSHDNWEAFEMWGLLLELGAKPIKVGIHEVVQF